MNWWQDPDKRIALKHGDLIQKGDVAYDPCFKLYTKGVKVTGAIGSRFAKWHATIYRKKHVDKVLPDRDPKTGRFIKKDSTIDITECTKGFISNVQSFVTRIQNWSKYIIQ